MMAIPMLLPLQNFDKYAKWEHGMQRNVVVKARVEDVDFLEAELFDLTDSLGTFFLQEDVYFHSHQGHLKLRIMHPNRCGQLIFYNTSKKSGPKLSESQISEVDDVFSLRATLGAALGEIGMISKRRRVFHNEDVRIYLDDVDEMGHFIDIAMPVGPDGDVKESMEKVDKVRRRLGVSDDSLVPVAYLDLLMCRHKHRHHDSFDDDLSVPSDSAPFDSAHSSDTDTSI